MRIRIPVGKVNLSISLLVLAFVSLFASVCVDVAAAQPAKAPTSFYFPAQLVIANGQGWSTSFVASSAEGGDFRYSDSVLIPPAHIVANGSFFLRDSAPWQTEPGFGAIAASENVEAFSVLSYRVNGELRAQFTVPVLEHVVYGDMLAGEIQRIVNDGTDITALVFINKGSVASSMTLRIRDGANAIVGTEYVTLPVGLTFYVLQTRVAAGRIEVLGGYGGLVIGGGGSTTPAVPVYGFAAIGPASGASQRIEVMR